MRPEDIPLDQATRIGFASSEGDGFTRWTELAVYYLNIPEFGQKQWLAEAKGVSTEEGERTKRRLLQAGTLDRALKLFEDSDLGRIASEQAREWNDERTEAAVKAAVWDAINNGIISTPGVESEPGPNDIFPAPGDYIRATASALGKTYDEVATDLERAAFARDVDVVRAAAQNGRLVDKDGKTVYDHHRTFTFATDKEALAWLYGEDATDLPRKLQRDFGIGESTVRAALKNETPVKVPLRSVLRWFDREAFRRDRESGE